jgi:hypothetical protein
MSTVEQMEAHEALHAEIDRLRGINAELLDALKPFAHFADQWDKNPLRGIAHDRTYVIHDGEDEGVFSLNDCYAARAAIAAAMQADK